LLLQQLDFIFIFIFGKGLDKQDPILADKADSSIILNIKISCSSTISKSYNMKTVILNIRNSSTCSSAMNLDVLINIKSKGNNLTTRRVGISSISSNI